MIYRYRTLEARAHDLQPNAVKLWEVWIDQDGQLVNEPMPENMTVAERLNQLGAEGWRIAHLTPSSWWLEKAEDFTLGNELGRGPVKRRASAGGTPPSSLSESV